MECPALNTVLEESEEKVLRPLDHLMVAQERCHLLYRNYLQQALEESRTRVATASLVVKAYWEKRAPPEDKKGKKGKATAKKAKK